MQITLSIPLPLLARIDATAASMGLSRSAFIRMRTTGATGAPTGELLPAAAPTHKEPPNATNEAFVESPALETRSRGTLDEPPAGYHLVTVMEQDLGKDAWMSAADAGIT